MASIQTGIELQDHFSSVMYGIINAVNLTVSAMQDMQSTMDSDMGTEAFEGIRNEINQAAVEMNLLEQSVADVGGEIDHGEHQQKEFNNEVQTGVTGANQLESAINGVVTAISGMFAIRKVIGWISDCTDAAATQGAAETQLATTIMNMGGTEKDYNAMVEKAQEIQQLGMYGDEAMIGAAAEFATYMSDTTAVEMMMDTLTDYAAGMSGGGAIDYDSMVNYATNLGKITTGAYDAMTKKGFEFTEAQKAVIKGTATEKQYAEALGEGWRDMSQDMASATIISDIISESWSGMYESLSNTPEAQLISLQNTMGDLMEVAGNEMNASLGNLWGVINSNMPVIESGIMYVANLIANIIDLISIVVDKALMVGSIISDNWSTIAPILWGIVAAIVAYNAIMGISAAYEAAAAIATGFLTTAKTIYFAAVTAATTGQSAFNAALLACPVTWIFIAILALIAAVVALANHIANTGGVATTAFGVICGGVNVVISFFKNLGLEVANIALGIGSAISALGTNIMAAFHNAISSVQSWFYDLLSTACSVISSIAAALNSLPFVEFDYSGITSAADDYASKSAAAASNKHEYTSISDAFSSGSSTYSTFQSGWASDAYAAGASWGDGIQNSVTGAIDDFFSSPSATSYDFGTGSGEYAETLGDIANSNNSIAGSASDLTASAEDLKYLRDIAEQDAINRFTTADITVNQTNNNTVNNANDIDGMVSNLTEGVNEALNIAAEGVHK